MNPDSPVTHVNRVTALTVGLCLLCSSLPALAQESQSQTEAKALSKAATEYRTLSRRDWQANNGDMEAMLQKTWKDQYEENEHGQRLRIIAYGNGSGATLEEAESEAMRKALDQIPGLFLLYFQSWNAALRAQGQRTQEEAQAVEQAVNSIGAQLAAAVGELQLTPTLNIFRERRGRYNVTVRVLHDQFELRSISRSLIVEVLMRDHGWDEQRAIELLTFPEEPGKRIQIF